MKIEVSGNQRRWYQEQLRMYVNITNYNNTPRNIGSLSLARAVLALNPCFEL